MTKLLFCLFLFVYCEVGEASVRQTFVYQSKPHHFLYVYQQIRKIEGFYVNHPKDRGRETYGGIARRFHPDWFGWRYIDKAKPLERHDIVPASEFWVMDFYLSIWCEEGFEVIEDRDLSLNLFDFRIHSSPQTVTKLTNRALGQMGCEPIDFKKNWVDNRFNKVDPLEFILRLKIQRLILFNYIVNRHPSQKVFYTGWINRISNI